MANKYKKNSGSYDITSQCHEVKISPQTIMILVVIQKSYNEEKENVIGSIGHVNIEIVSLFMLIPSVIGCSTLPQGYCKLIGLYWILMRR